MRFSDIKILTPIFEMAADAIADLKNALAGKIKQLPADEGTVKTLREIEDLLRDVNAGGRVGLINKDLKSIGDPTVNAAQQLLARYIISIDATPEQRNELYSLWRADKLVNLDKMLEGDRVGFSEVFAGYDTNPLIQELVDELMRVMALGHGKGEFGLSVLSKRINKPESTKGDLLVKYGGKTLSVEVKTSDTAPDKKGSLKKSSARFGDQEVRPTADYAEGSKKLNAFASALIKKLGSKGLLSNQAKKGLGDSGLSLTTAIELVKAASPDESSTLLGLIRYNIKQIFGNWGDSTKEGYRPPRPEYRQRLMKNINTVLSSIESGDVNGALQAYSQATFNYYMARKHDDGVLYIDLGAGTFVWYTKAEDLGSKGLRLHAQTIYLSGANPARTVYPQIEINPRTYGTDVVAPGLEKALRADKAKLPKKQTPEFIAQQKAAFVSWATKFANLRNVKDQRVIQKMANAAYEMKLAGVPTDQVIAELEQQFPQLVKTVIKPRQVPQAKRLYTPFVPPKETEPEEV